MSSVFDQDLTDDTDIPVAPTETPQAPASDATSPPAAWMDQNPQFDANGNLKPEHRPQPKWKPDGAK